MIYTPMDGSQTLNVLVYAHFGCSPDMKGLVTHTSWQFDSQSPNKIY